MTESPRYVADAHALIFHVADGRKLGAKARAEFEEAEAGRAVIIVPIIVLAEIAWAAEKKRISLDFDDLFSAIAEHGSYRIAPLDEVLLEHYVSSAEIPEMHDRFIVAEAKRSGAMVLTRDPEITAVGSVPVIW